MPMLHLVADLHLGRSHDHDAAITTALAGLAFDPGDLLAVLGDVTDDGEAGQYATALRLLAPYRDRILLVPGNHDAGRLGLLTEAGARRRWRQLVAALGGLTSARCGSRWLVALDSCRYTVLPTDLARGRLGRAETRRAVAGCAEARRRFLRPTLLLHHWPWCSDPTLALDDGDEVQRLVAVQQCDLWAGHTHHADRRSGPGWRAVCLADLASTGRAEVVDCG